MFRVKRKRAIRDFYCEHCDETLSRSAYWKHRKAYFNPTTNEWTKKEPSEHDTFSQTDNSELTDSLNFDYSSSDEGDSQAKEEEGKQFLYFTLESMIVCILFHSRLQCT